MIRIGRVGAALILLPPLLAILFFAPTWGFLLLTEAVAVLAAHEFFALFKGSGYRPFRTLGTLAALVLVATFYFTWLDARWVMMITLVVVGSAAVRRANTGASGPGEVALTLFGACYVGFLLGSVIGLLVSPPDGRRWVVLLLAMTFLGDTGAYYVGRRFGNRPLTPRLSPKKTWAGFYGGIAASIAASLVACAILFESVPWWHAVGLGAGVALIGVIGDLFESLLKRAAGVKDASSLIPGHGGMLDRLDSLLFSAPALLLYVRTAGPM